MPRPAPSEPQERKTFPGFTLSANQHQGIVEHVVAVIGNVDDGKDVIHPGSFKKTISERALRVRVLDQHRSDSVLRILGKPLEMHEIGRSELPQQLLDKFPDATGGLRCTTQFLMSTPEGAGAFERAKEGLVEWSIGFDVMPGGMDYSKKDGETIRNLRELRLWEYSPVLWGMNAATTTISAKGADREAPEDKELDPNGTPIQRIGDVLNGSLHKLFTDLADGWYINGYMTRDDRIGLSRAVGDALDALTNGIPDAIAQIQVSYYAPSSYGMMAHEHEHEAKSWDTAYQNALPDSAFAIVEGSGDSKVRKLPHHDKGGAVDLPHLRNALARVNQVTGVSDAAKSKAESHLNAHAKSEGVGEAADKAGRSISAASMKHVQAIHDHTATLGADCYQTDPSMEQEPGEQMSLKAAASAPADPVAPSPNGTRADTGLLGEIDRLLIDTHLFEMEAV